jgi:hypothetical protein
VLTETPKISAKGTFGGILVAAEHHKQKAAGTSTNVEQKVTVLHVGGKAGAIKWDVAQYKNKDANAGSNAKFAPLGSMLVGKSAPSNVSSNTNMCCASNMPCTNNSSISCIHT